MNVYEKYWISGIIKELQIKITVTYYFHLPAWHQWEKIVPDVGNGEGKCANYPLSMGESSSINFFGGKIVNMKKALSKTLDTLNL